MEYFCLHDKQVLPFYYWILFVCSLVIFAFQTTVILHVCPVLDILTLTRSADYFPKCIINQFLIWLRNK